MTAAVVPVREGALQPQHILVGGGVRSGKSAFALDLARSLGSRRVFLATAQAFDDEMRRRVSNHQAERGTQFITRECPLQLPEALNKIEDTDVVLIDCLTLWLSNMLLADFGEERIERRVADLQKALDVARFHTVIVTNEVGMGIVPDTPLGRLFRDVSGRAHQTLAARASTVYMAMLGMRLRLRPGPVEVMEPGGAL